MKNLKVHIIGGTGVMGNWLKNYLESHKVVVTVSGRGGVEDEVLQEAQIIFISVPISLAPKIISKVAKKVSSKTVLIDLSSTQARSAQALQKTKRPSASLHFLFGPNIVSIKNQKIILSVIKKHEFITKLKNILASDAAQVIELSVREHDLYMAHIQNLTHFTNLSLAQTYLKNGLKLDGKISTPNSLSQLAVISSIISQPESLIAEIQLGNPVGKKVIKTFITEQLGLVKLIETKDSKKIEKLVSQIKKSVDLTPKPIQNIKIKPPRKIKLKGKVGYLGPEGTFSNQAALMVAKSLHLNPCTTILQVFERVDEGQLNYGIVPAENSTEGTIRETLDYLLDFNLKTNGSIDLNIHQNLLSDEENLNQVISVYSHPQGLAQCRLWLRQNLPNAKLLTANSTVSAISEHKSEKGAAFIAPEIAASLNNIKILVKNIEDRKENITKFYIVSKTVENISSAGKTLLFLTVFNRVGILRDILDVFAENDINLSKIESRPSREKIWDYHFFIEVDISQTDKRLTQALNLLKTHCPVIKVLGGV